MAVTLVDTAGIRQTGEGECGGNAWGIERSRQEVEKGRSGAFFCWRGNAAPSAEDMEIYELLKTHLHLTVINKSGLGDHARCRLLGRRFGDVLWVSAEDWRWNAGVGKNAWHPHWDWDAAGTEAREATQITNLRHAELLTAALESLTRARAAFDAGLFGELTMVDVSETLENLGEILGPGGGWTPCWIAFFARFLYREIVF